MIRYRGCYGRGLYSRCEILLDNGSSEILTNFDTIRGRVILMRDVDRDFNFQDLRIRLEGYVTSKFAISNVDRRKILNSIERFLPDESSEESFAASIVSLYFIRDGKPKKPEYQIVAHKDVQSFPFELPLRGQTLPASFESDYGKIYYQVVVYGNLNSVEAKKTLRTKGCFNLCTEDPNYSRPLIVNWISEKISSSLFSFSRRPFLSPTLTLNRRGFLPGDRLTFQLDVVNSVGDQNFSKLSALLVQKIIYFANKNEKIKTNILDQREIIVEGNLQLSVHWEGAFIVPRNLMPTFNQTKKQPVKIRYYLQIIVLVDGRPALKGEAPIIIGTTRDDYYDLTDRIPEIAGPSRRTSIELPPPYLSLDRQSRRSSLESLPPTYEEALSSLESKWAVSDTMINRPRSNSSVM